MATYDIVDGGIAATFIDGPKKGHVGVVDPDDGVPPAELVFLETLVYRRHAKTRVECVDAFQQPQRYRGIAYRVDPTCPFMVRMRQEVAQAVADAQAGKVEAQ